MVRYSLGVAVLVLLGACNADPAPADDETSSEGAEATEGESGETGDTGEVEPELPPDLIFDADNRALILHGINLHNASKYEDDLLPTISEDDVARMAHDWGFNAVRFLIFWEAIEPEPGVYDDDYLAAVAERVAWFEAEGIYVILDMHQDVYAQVFCCDGAPMWAVRDDGEPFVQQDVWSFNYTQPAVQRAFDNFWAGDGGNHPDLQEHYVATWRHVVEAFAGTPNLLGYDLINEPFAGTGWSLVDLDFPDPNSPVAAWESGALVDFYDRLAASIREIDQDAWLFFEPRYGAAANGHPSYLLPPIDPREGGPRMVYYPHLYPIEPEIFGTWEAKNPSIPRWEDNRSIEQEAFGTAVMLGEFGIMPDWEFGPELLAQALAMADRATTGWTYWSYDTNGRGIIDSVGAERPAAAMLTRTYAQRVAGTPLEHGYDPESRVMVLRFEDRAGVSGATEIFVPESRWYPNGWELVVDDPDGTWSSSWDAEREILSVTTDPDQGPEHRIEVRPL